MKPEVRKQMTGVHVPGELILTATHCIDWSGTGGMVLGDEYPTDIETASGVKFRAGVCACDPVSDIAVCSGNLTISGAPTPPSPSCENCRYRCAAGWPAVL